MKKSIETFFPEKYIFFIGVAAFLQLQILFCNEGFSQKILTGKEANEYIHDSKYIHFGKSASIPDFIKLRHDAGITQNSFGSWIAKALKMNPEEKFIPFRSENDKLGYTHIRYQLYYKNNPVEAAVFIGHYDADGWLQSANGFYRGSSFLNSSAEVLKEPEALNTALSHVNAKEYMWENKSKENFLKLITENPGASYYPGGELIYFPENRDFDSDKFNLSYKFDVYALQPLKRAYVYVDAQTGKILYEINGLHTADTAGIAITKYSGQRNIITDTDSINFRLRESGRGGGIITYNGLIQDTVTGEFGDFTDSDNFWNNVNAQQDEVATDAHWGAEMAYDFYYNTFGRNSYDNAGTKIYSLVHGGYPWVNAVWDSGYISYGDGDSINGPLTSVEIVGHELTHGVTQYSAGLFYDKEPGALNESFSDIFGTAIDFYAKPLTANFLIGEEIGVPWRSMENPNLFDCPDTYLGDFWFSNGDVHTNSGVPNFWFYLLCMGGTGTNDTGNTYSVSGIGIDKAAQIAYRTLTVYLTPSSDFINARIFSSQSAADLFGDCSAEVTATENAWYAVGVGGQYFSSTVSDFSVDNIAPCSIYDTVHFLNFSSTANAFQWNFGDGATSASEHPWHVYNAEGTYTVQLIASASGNCGNGVDTTVKTGFVTVTNTGPRPISCIPAAVYNAGIGIYNVSFNSINNSSTPYDIYIDYTCVHQTSVIAGNTYTVSVETDEWNSKNTDVWIDWNNNGSFEVSELIFATDSQLQFHSGNVTIPNNSVKNIPLRMRAAAHTQDSISPCFVSMYGEFEFEDYSVMIEPVSGEGEIEFHQTFSIFPNPTNGKFKIHSTMNEVQSIKIFNVLGENIYSEKRLSLNHEIENSFPKGIYFITLVGEEKSVTKKMIIN